MSSLLQLVAYVMFLCVAALDGQHEEVILSIADHHACAVEQTSESDVAGELVCWGLNDESEVEAPQVSMTTYEN